MAETIKITFGAGRQVRIETKGFTGGACKEATRELEAALGVVKADKPTAEAFLQAEKKQVQGR